MTTESPNLPSLVTKLGLHYQNLATSNQWLAKCTHGTRQTIQAVAKPIDCSQQNDSKAPMLKTMPISFIEQREVELVPIWSLHQCCKNFLYECAVHTTDEKGTHQTLIRPLIYSTVLPAGYARTMVWQKVGETQEETKHCSSGN